MSRTSLYFLLFLIAAASLPLLAQQTLGGITGTVTDSTGAAIPDAAVTIKNVDTNLEIKAATQANGSYLVPNLPIGNYTVSIVKEGFKDEVHTAILVEGNRTTTVNGRLEVGAVATTVEVTGTPMLNQVDTTSGYVLGIEAINNTPLGTGSITQLAILNPGVSADFLNTSGTNAGLGNQAIWANGQRDTSNSISVNGLTNNNLFNGKTTSQVVSSRFTLSTGSLSAPAGDTQTNTSVYDSIGNSISTPAPEAMQELRVNTAMYDASQGGKSGAHITAITRSGTNSVHGQVFEHFQNNIFNAAEFFRNASSAIAPSDKVPALHYNRFGGTLGGPVKKNKLFYFVGYNGIRNHDNLNSSKTVTVPLHLTDDRSAAAIAAMAQADFGVALTPSQIDPAALKLMNFKVGNTYLIPTPSITDSATAIKLGYDAYLQAPSFFTSDQFLANVDYNFSDKDRFSEKYIWQSSPNSSPFSGSNTYGFPQQNQAGSQTLAFDNTTILTPSLTWEQKIGFVRMASYENTQQPLTAADAGIDMFGSQTFPAISISRAGSTAFGNSFTLGTYAATANAGTYQNQFSGGTTLNWVHGRHVVYAGFNLDQNQLNIINHANGAAGAEVAFNYFSDFLQGNLQNSTYNRYFMGASNRYYRAWLAGGFVQDNVRLTSNLNLSFGLRYDYSGPFWEKNGYLVSFHPDQYSYNSSTDTVSGTGLVIAGNNQTLGTPGISDSTLTGRQWGLGPRVGLVWSPRALRNVVIRAGFGLFYDRGEYFTEFSPPAGQGFNGPFGVTLAPPFVQQINAVYPAKLDAPFAGAVIPAPVTSQTLFAGLVPNAASLLKKTQPYLFGGYDPSNGLPYTQSYNFDIQWQPLNTVQMSLGYVGNRSLHQILPIPFNQPYIATPANPIRGETMSYGFNMIPTETAKTYDYGNTDLRTPYLGFSDNSIYYKAEGIANYNSLQYAVRKRMSRGLQFIGTYTWSHTLDEQSGMGLFFNGNDPTNLRNSYGTSTYDRTHVLTAQYFYEFPKAASSDHSPLGIVANGWRLNGIVTFQSGFPYNAYDYSGAVAGQYYGSGVSVMDPVLPLKPGVSVAQATLQGTTGYDIDKPFINANSFYAPTVAPGQNGAPPCTTVNGNQVCDTFETTYGNTARNTFRSPFQSRADMSASKETRLKERVVVRFQADFFNIFNHPVFDAPNVYPKLYSVSSSVASLATPSASFGLIQHTIGSPRFVQFSLSLAF